MDEPELSERELKLKLAKKKLNKFQKKNNKTSAENPSSKEPSNTECETIDLQQNEAVASKPGAEKKGGRSLVGSFFNAVNTMIAETTGNVDRLPATLKEKQQSLSKPPSPVKSEKNQGDIISAKTSQLPTTSDVSSFPSIKTALPPPPPPMDNASFSNKPTTTSLKAAIKGTSELSPRIQSFIPATFTNGATFEEIDGNSSFNIINASSKSPFDHQEIKYDDQFSYVQNCDEITDTQEPDNSIILKSVKEGVNPFQSSPYNNADFSPTGEAFDSNSNFIQYSEDPPSSSNSSAVPFFNGEISASENNVNIFGVSNVDYNNQILSSPVVTIPCANGEYPTNGEYPADTQNNTHVDDHYPPAPTTLYGGPSGTHDNNVLGHSNVEYNNQNLHSTPSTQPYYNAEPYHGNYFEQNNSYLTQTAYDQGNTTTVPLSTNSQTHYYDENYGGDYVGNNPNLYQHESTNSFYPVDSQDSYNYDHSSIEPSSINHDQSNNEIKFSTTADYQNDFHNQRAPLSSPGSQKPNVELNFIGDTEFNFSTLSNDHTHHESSQPPLAAQPQQSDFVSQEPSDLVKSKITPEVLKPSSSLTRMPEVETTSVNEHVHSHPHAKSYSVESTGSLYKGILSEYTTASTAAAPAVADIQEERVQHDGNENITHLQNILDQARSDLEAITRERDDLVLKLNGMESQMSKTNFESIAMEKQVDEYRNLLSIANKEKNALEMQLAEFQNTLSVEKGKHDDDLRTREIRLEKSKLDFEEKLKQAELHQAEKQEKIKLALEKRAKELESEWKVKFKSTEAKLHEIKDLKAVLDGREHEIAEKGLLLDQSKREHEKNLIELNALKTEVEFKENRLSEDFRNLNLEKQQLEFKQKQLLDDSHKLELQREEFNKQNKLKRKDSESELKEKYLKVQQLEEEMVVKFENLTKENRAKENQLQDEDLRLKHEQVSLSKLSNDLNAKMHELSQEKLNVSDLKRQLESKMENLKIENEGLSTTRKKVEEYKLQLLEKERKLNNDRDLLKQQQTQLQQQRQEIESERHILADRESKLRNRTESILTTHSSESDKLKSLKLQLDQERDLLEVEREKILQRNEEYKEIEKELIKRESNLKKYHNDLNARDESLKKTGEELTKMQKRIEEMGKEQQAFKNQLEGQQAELVKEKHRLENDDSRTQVALEKQQIEQLKIQLQRDRDTFLREKDSQNKSLNEEYNVKIQQLEKEFTWIEAAKKELAARKNEDGIKKDLASSLELEDLKRENLKLKHQLKQQQSNSDDHRIQQLQHKIQDLEKLNQQFQNNILILTEMVETARKNHPSPLNTPFYASSPVFDRSSNAFEEEERRFKKIVDNGRNELMKLQADALPLLEQFKHVGSVLAANRSRDADGELEDVIKDLTSKNEQLTQEIHHLSPSKQSSSIKNRSQNQTSFIQSSIKNASRHRIPDLSRDGLYSYFDENDMASFSDTTRRILAGEDILSVECSPSMSSSASGYGKKSRRRREKQ